MFKNTKLYGTILGIILFIILIAGLTYAYITWTSSNIDFSVKSDCFVVNYVKGQNISNNNMFVINEKDKIGLIGVNGTGKSTLLNMIAGYTNYEGQILRKKDIRISFLPQNPNFNDENTVIKQCYEYIDASVAEYEMKAMLNKFGISDYDQKIKELSGGQKKRVALARTLVKPADVLIPQGYRRHQEQEDGRYHQDGQP